MLEPGDIAQAALPRRLRGYDRDAVDRLRHYLDSGHRVAWNERDRLRAEIERLERESSAASELDTELRDTLLTAQRLAAELRHAAESEAEAILAAARSREGNWHPEIEAQRAAVEREIVRLHRLEDDFRAGARAVVEDALARLDLAEPAPELPPVAAIAVPALPSLEDDTLSFPAPPVEEEEQQEEPVEAVAVEPEPAPTAVSPQPEALPPADVAPVEREAEPSPPPAAEAEPKRRPPLGPLLLSIAILAVGAGIAVAVWQLASDDAPSTAPSPTTTATSPATIDSATTAAAGTPASTAEDEATTAEASEVTTVAPERARLALRATGGDAWVQVRSGSSAGRLLFEGFLFDGESRQFVGRKLWMRVGDPTALVVRLNGERVADLPSGTANLLVTPTDVRTISLG